jgi:hypothetical protein
MRKKCTLITSKATDIDENIANQNHATRTRTPKPGYLNLSNMGGGGGWGLKNKSELFSHFSSSFVCFAYTNGNYWGGGLPPASDGLVMGRVAGGRSV